MDQKSLKMFLTLADTLHFAKAAALSYMTPSALSRAIRRMEEEVGAELFTRDNRQVVLTSTGMKFRDYAHQSIAAWERLQQELADEGQTLQGELRLYGSVTAAYSVLAPVLEVFRQRYPGIEIHLHTGDQAEAIPRVKAGEDDIGIAARPKQLSPSLSFQTLTYSPLHIIIPAKPGVVRDQVLRQLQQQEFQWQQIPFIVAESGLARTRLLDWFKQHDARPNIYAQVSGHEAIVSMVGLGFGVALVPDIVTHHSPLRDSIEIMDIELNLPPFAIGMCAKKHQLHNPLLTAFWQTAQEWANLARARELS